MFAKHLGVRDTQFAFHLIGPGIRGTILPFFYGFHVLEPGIISGIKLFRVVIPVCQSQSGTYPPFHRGKILRHEIICQREIFSLVPAILARVPQRIRGFKEIIILQPLLNRTRLVTLLVIRIRCRIFTESHDRVPVIG